MGTEDIKRQIYCAPSFGPTEFWQLFDANSPVHWHISRPENWFNLCANLRAMPYTLRSWEGKKKEDDSNSLIAPIRLHSPSLVERLLPVYSISKKSARPYYQDEVICTLPDWILLTPKAFVLEKYISSPPCTHVIMALSTIIKGNTNDDWLDLEMDNLDIMEKNGIQFLHLVRCALTGRGTATWSGKKPEDSGAHWGTMKSATDEIVSRHGYIHPGKPLPVKITLKLVRSDFAIPIIATAEDRRSVRSRQMPPSHYYDLEEILGESWVWKEQ
jgi:hypothetical protein